MALNPLTLFAPQWSFVQLGDYNPPADCIQSPGLCLPTAFPSNTTFQMFATGVIDIRDCPTIPAANAVRFNAIPVPYDYNCLGSITDITGDFQIPIWNQAMLHSGTAYSGFDYILNFDDFWFSNFDDWNAISNFPIEVGDCFKYLIVQNWVAADSTVMCAVVVGCTNCFIRIAATDQCFHSVLRYKNEENAYYFDYETKSFRNVVMLPFYLKNPQLPIDEKSYRKSDGSYIKLFSRMDEEFELETDYMPYDWHRKLQIALQHDDVIIQNNNKDQLAADMPAQFVCTEEYDIEWNAVPYHTVAKANTKVIRASAVNLFNRNCG